MLYILSGVSCSGKSSICSQISKDRNINRIDTDTLRTMTNILRPDINVGHDKNVLENYRNMNEVVEALIYAKSFFKEDFLLEGDCIQISLIASLVKNNEARAVVVGYPNDTVSERFELIIKNKDYHWSKNLENKRLKQKIQEFISFSNFLKKEAKKHSLVYIDASSKKTIDTIHDEISYSLFG